MQPKGRRSGSPKAPAKGQEKLTPKERAKVAPPGTEVDAEEFMDVLRRLASTPAKKRTGTATPRK